MARMPTRDSLPQATPTSDKTIVRAPTNQIGEAVSSLGINLARHAKADKEKQGSLELARARSFWQTSLLTGRKAYNLKYKPDYKTWGRDADSGARDWQKKAMEHITDPDVRERFKLETDDDRVQFNISVGNEAQGHSNTDQLTTAQAAIDQMAANAADPDITEDERADLRQDIWETYKGLVNSGIKTKEQAAVEVMLLKKRISKLRVMQDIQDDPVMASNGIGGGKVTDAFKKKVRRRESGNRDDAKNPNSSATGRYQFTEGTWLGLMKNHPGLGLTANGRGDAEQQERAMDKLIDINSAVLKQNGIPVSEANLYVLHFMGEGAGPDLLGSDPSEDAAALFPKEAAANKTIFFNKDGTGKPVGKVLQDLTRKFSQQGGPAPIYYNDLNAEDRVQLGAAADLAAEKHLAEIDKEARIDEARGMVDYAVSQFADRDEAARYIKNNASDPAVREDALSALDAEYRRQDQAEQKSRVEQYDTTFTKVQELIEAGDLDGARKSVPADMPGEERRKLLQLIDKGPATTDDSVVFRDLQAMRMSDTASFAEVDLRKFQTELTPGTIDQLHAYQQKLKEDKVNHTTLQTADTMLKDEMRTMGVVVGAKASAADVRYSQRVRAMAAPEIERREDIKGKPLTTRELQEVIDDTFVSFRDQRPSGWGWSEVREITVIDVFKEFNEYEDDNDLTIGSLMDEAMRQARRANPDKQPTAQQLATWLYDYKNDRQLK